MNKFETENPNLKPQMDNILQTLFTYTTISEIPKNFELVQSVNKTFNPDTPKEKEKFKKQLIESSSSLNITKSKFTKYIIYNKVYTKETKNALIYNISKIIYFTYRKNFSNILNSIGQKFNCDTGWGCMLRCGQMILARGIYKYLKKLGNSTKSSLLQSIYYFFENPFSFENMPDNFINMMNYYLNVWYKEHKNDIILKLIYPPFSIKSLCSVGRICNKEVGNWFSDVNACYIFKIINQYFHLFKELKIFTFQSCIDINEIIDNCFEKESNIYNKDDFILKENEEKLYFSYKGIIFVSVRLGLNEIPKEYHIPILKVFSCKNCIGFIGGKDKRAFYFIGYDENGHLLYVDPHFTNETLQNVNENNFVNNYLIKDIYSISLKKMSSAFTIGFIFRNFNEYKQLIDFLKTYTEQQFPCFGISGLKKNKYNQKNLLRIEKKMFNDIDDF